MTPAEPRRDEVEPPGEASRPRLPDDLERGFTQKALGKVGGAALAVFVVTGGLATAFGWQPRWLGLGIALLLAVAFFHPRRRGRFEWGASALLLTGLNSFLIYSEAVGFNSMSQAVNPPKAERASLIPFLDPEPWWPPAGLTEEVERSESALREAVRREEEASTLLRGVSRELTTLRDDLTDLTAYVRKSREDLERAVERTNEETAEVTRRIERVPVAERRELTARLARLKTRLAEDEGRLRVAKVQERSIAQSLDAGGKDAPLSALSRRAADLSRTVDEALAALGRR